MESLTAEQAKEKANYFNNNKHLVYWLNRIDQAASVGLMNRTYYNSFMHSDTLNALENLGYKVTIHSSQSDNYFRGKYIETTIKISWE